MQSTELSIQEMERCKLETDIVGFEIGITASRDKCSGIIHTLDESSVKPQKERQ